jgi:hypothetical protein
MAQKSDIKILSVNKTVVFTSPLEDSDEVLVRTGTISQGSSFFHSVLHAYSKEYVNMNKTERMNYVRKLRVSMVGKIDKDSWEELAGGTIAKTDCKELLYKTLKNFDNFLSENNDKIRGKCTRKVVKILITNKDELEVYKVILTLVPIEFLINNILPKSYQKSESLSLKDTNNCIITDAVAYLNNLEEMKMIDNGKKDYLSNVFMMLLKVICSETYKESYKNYIESIKDTKEDVDSNTIEFISSRFNRDLYFIDGVTRVPYDVVHPEQLSKNNNNKKSIILLRINNHYEVLGRLLPGNKVQREFDNKDPLIVKITMFLREPERIRFNYPQLNKYLTKSPTRKSFSTKKNEETPEKEEQSDVESDLYYDSSPHHSENESDRESNENNSDTEASGDD